VKVRTKPTSKTRVQKKTYVERDARSAETRERL
jgi:hypothetical protein